MKRGGIEKQKHARRKNTGESSKQQKRGKENLHDGGLVLLKVGRRAHKLYAEKGAVPDLRHQQPAQLRGATQGLERERGERTANHGHDNGGSRQT